MNSHHVHLVRFRQLHCVVRILYSLETRNSEEWRRRIFIFIVGERGLRWRYRNGFWLGNASPCYRARYQLVESLKNDKSVLTYKSFSLLRTSPFGKTTTNFQVLNQVVDCRVDIQGIEPEGEYSGLSFSLSIKVFHRYDLRWFDRLKTWVRIEEVSDESEIETRVTGHERRWGEIFAAAYAFGIVQDLAMESEQL